MLRTMSILGRGRLAGFAALFGLVACAGSDSKGGPARQSTAPASSNAADSASSAADSASNGSNGSNGSGDGSDGWRTLITGEWAMPPGAEGYVCARQTIDEDLYVNGFDAIKPLGTHHTLLTMGAPNAPDA